MRPVIEKMARFGRDHFALLIVFIAGLGTAHILVRTATYGAAVNGDSLFFLSTAMNVLAGESWRDLWGDPLTGWPPLFPLLLAAFGWVGFDPLAAGRWINAAAFGLTLLAAGCWLRSNVRSRLLALTATAIIAASLPLSHWAAYFLTDPLFVLFTLLALIQLVAFLHRGERTPLLLSAAFTALAALTRYPGVVLIGTGVLVLLPLARLRHTLVFGAVSSLPLLAVLAHNWAAAGNLTQTTGDRSPRGQSLSDGLSQIVAVFHEWVVPPNAPNGTAYLLWLAVGLIGLAGAAVVLRGRRPDPAAMSPSVGLGPVLLFGGYAVAYSVFMVAVVPFTVYQGIDTRYLLPIYGPLLLTAAFLLDRFLSIEATGRMAAAQYGLAFLVVLATLAHIGYSAHGNYTLTARAYISGFRDWTYNGSYWASSEILNYIRDNRIHGTMFSNNRYLAWFWDRTAAPGKHQPLPSEIHHLTSAIPEWTADDTPYIVWLRHEKSFYDYNDLDIRCLPGVEPVAELYDGVVFRVMAAEPFDAEKHRARKQRYVEQLTHQAGERVVRADWDVYRNGRTLTYRKNPCAPDDTQAEFILRAIPADPADLPAHRRPYGYDPLNFHFHVRGGVRLDDQCVVTVPLPSYDIIRIRVGQYSVEESRTVWETAAEPFNAERHRAQRQRHVDQLIQQADEQVARAGWSVYRNGRTLIYRKKSCVSADVQAKLFLHVIPADPADLPANRQQHGYDALGFYFDQRGFRLDDQCIAIAQLPDYDIGRIRVGQWIAKGNRTLWEAEFLEIGG